MKERNFYKEAIRPFLFSLEAETAHRLTLAMLKVAERSHLIRTILVKMYNFEDPRLEVELWGKIFKNPVGLAPALDKNAEVVLATSCLGFGYIEVGSVTYLPQEGNRKPRIFRLVEDKAIINKIGMANQGAERVAANLKKCLRERTLPIGVNIASSTETEEPIDDYLKTFEKVYHLADYLVLNVSCPNVNNYLLQQRGWFLNRLVARITEKREKISEKDVYRPILIKISPDLSWQEIDNVLNIVQKKGLDGIVATNTTLQRKGLNSQFENEAGGLSGRPLKQRSTEIIAYIHQQMPELAIIGVGGIETAEDAWEKLQAGATLIQLFTPMVFEGPAITKKIKTGLVDLTEKGGDGLVI